MEKQFFISPYNNKELTILLGFLNSLNIFSPTFCNKNYIYNYNRETTIYKRINKNSSSNEYFFENTKYDPRDYIIYSHKYYNIISIFINCFNYIENFNILYDILNGSNVSGEKIESKILIQYERNIPDEVNNLRCQYGIPIRECELFGYRKLAFEISAVYNKNAKKNKYSKYFNILKDYVVRINNENSKRYIYNYPFSNINIDEKDEKNSNLNLQTSDQIMNYDIERYYKKYNKYIQTQLHYLLEYIDNDTSNLIVDYCRFEKK